jgi:hypothetical protein
VCSHTSDDEVKNVFSYASAAEVRDLVVVLKYLS